MLYPLAAERGLTLTHDEIDVSSAMPSPLYRTRNKVHPRVPLCVDGAVRAWFATRRAADVTYHRFRRSAARKLAQATP